MAKSTKLKIDCRFFAYLLCIKVYNNISLVEDSILYINKSICIQSNVFCAQKEIFDIKHRTEDKKKETKKEIFLKKKDFEMNISRQ